MSIYRTYFDKDAVIIRNSCANTGRNPIAEIYHGGSKLPVGFCCRGKECLLSTITLRLRFINNTYGNYTLKLLVWADRD